MELTVLPKVRWFGLLKSVCRVDLFGCILLNFSLYKGGGADLTWARFGILHI